MNGLTTVVGVILVNSNQVCNLNRQSGTHACTEINEFCGKLFSWAMIADEHYCFAFHLQIAGLPTD
jgi:hypothetical protein